MTRNAIVIFISLLFTGIEKLNNSLPQVQSQRIVAMYEAAEYASHKQEQLSTPELENFISTSSASSTSVTARGNSSSHNTARHRHSQSTKQAIHTSPSRHKGHVTDIFNFNQHTSSLRVVYYLHTLCRLRI